MMLGSQAWADVDFGTEEVVNTTTTWTFNDYTTGSYYTTNKAWNVSEKLYARSIESRGFTITELSEGQQLAFSDGYVVRVTKFAASNSGVNIGSTSTTKTAGTANTSDTTPAFAFNASVAGTCYVYFKGIKASTEPAVNASLCRIYFAGSSDTKPGSKASTEVTDEDVYYEVKYTSTEAGAFFITSARNSCEIYAIRFVPTSEKKDKWIYIGSTGYATFSYGSGHYTTPDGLSVYGAKASSDGTVVELIPAVNIKKMSGYILKGTPNTNYYLTSTSTAPTNPSGNELQYASGGGTKTFSVDSDGKDSENKYNYILAAEGGVAKFFVVKNGTTLASGKAWLKTSTQLTPTSEARGISIVFADETTGIETVQTSRNNENGSLQGKASEVEFYNLKGQRVAQPTKGLYVVNGKKVIIK